MGSQLERRLLRDPALVCYALHAGILQAEYLDIEGRGFRMVPMGRDGDTAFSSTLFSLLLGALRPVVAVVVGWWPPGVRMAGL